MDRPRASYEQYRASRDPKPPGKVDAVVGGLLGWIFVVVGVAAIGAAGLIPAYLKTLDLQDQRRILETKADALKQEHDRYQQFHAALVDDDPVLIERLALTELRLRPVGTGVAQTRPRDPAAIIDSPDPDAIRQATDLWTDTGSIEQWLSRADLLAEPPAPAQRPRQTRLLTYATGEHRPWVAGFGALLILLGLWPRRTGKPDRPDGDLLAD
ncbi:MAG: hypothetical protein ACIAXF_11195 [Phycisphaerales bacterium JB063]